jgi:hypothetical protein
MKHIYTNIICLFALTAALILASKDYAVAQVLPNTAWEKYARVDDSEKQAVAGVIKKLFDGMSAGDSATIRSLFYDTQDRMHTVQHFFPPRKDTTSVVQFGAVSEFLGNVGKMKQQNVAFEERILSYTVQRDGDFASVWCPYEVYVNGQFRHCGVDVFTMTKTLQGWKILHISDTRRKDGCK